MNFPACSAHNYKILLEYWSYLTQRTSLKIKKITVQDGFPIFKITNHPIGLSPKGLYLSAGIHGDEPAGCWSLFRWAQRNQDFFDRVPVLIFPCLNPWGLINNARQSQAGHDLNRIWLDKGNQLVDAVTKSMSQISTFLSLNLHEDFDGQGIYLYEPYKGGRPDHWAKEILAAGTKNIPIDKRTRIEGRRAKNGVIRPNKKKIPCDGMPEALHLCMHYQGRNFTLETPSEESLEKRIYAHVAMIERAVQLGNCNSL